MSESRKRRHDGSDDASDVRSTASSSKFAMGYLRKFGFQEGQGLGRDGSGIVEPIQAVGYTKRRGLGDDTAKLFAVEVGKTWNEQQEDKYIEENPTFLQCRHEDRNKFMLHSSWIRNGKPKRNIDDEDKFCDADLVKELLEAKTVFDKLDQKELNLARQRANPYETIKNSIFQNRAAVKMANLDRIFNWSLSEEFDHQRRVDKCPMDRGIVPTNDLSRQSEVWYFADVCAGPGGFSEYLLWRKGFYNCKGFGFTLKGDCDFKLEKFIAGSHRFFDTYYGPKDNGDVYDPENLIALEKYVKDRTDGLGVHLVTCDGGFSVEGQENIQEILSAQLYLCQFIVGLSLCRVETDEKPGGKFICKLFDIFTPFSVGLIYLMYIAFQKISLHKPITSRPANSERYIYCEGLTDVGATTIKEHLVAVNNRLESFKNTKKQDEITVLEIVPLEVLQADDDFFDYIRNHNEVLIKRQILYLQKYFSFAKNQGHFDRDQGRIREQSLAYWEIPSIDRKMFGADSCKPANMQFKAMIPKDFSLDNHFKRQDKVVDLAKQFSPAHQMEIFHEEYYVQTTCSKNPPFLIFSDLKERCFVRPSDSKQFTPKDEYPNFPRKSIFLAELCPRWTNGSKEKDVLRILDAAVINGDDVSHLHVDIRLKAAEKLLKAFVMKNSKVGVTVATPCPMLPRNLNNFFTDMFPSSVGKFPFTRPRKDELHFYYPATGLRLIRTIKHGAFKCWSRSNNCKYYFESSTGVSYEYREATPMMTASFWDGLSHPCKHISWDLSQHSQTTSENILESASVSDAITVPAFCAHIQDCVDKFSQEHKVNID